MDSELHPLIKALLEDSAHAFLTDWTWISLLAVRVHDLVVLSPGDTPQFWVTMMSGKQVSSGIGRSVANLRIERTGTEAR